jgi:MscS family membrane protein
MSTILAHRTVLSIVIASVFSTAPLAGQADGQRDTTGKIAAVAGADEQASPASPRGALERFLDLTHAGRYADAVSYLDLPDSLRARGPMLARQLRAVLDRYVSFDLQEVSASTMGDTADGLRPGVDQVAEIRGPNGDRQPVRLTRVQENGETLWRFSRGTMARIPAWYSGLQGRWAFEHLPAVLLRTGPFDLLLWQWAALPLLLLLATLLGQAASRVLQTFFGRIAQRTSNEWDNVLLARLGAPLTVACALVATGALLPFLGLYPPAASLAYKILRGAFLLVIFWSLWRLVDVGHQLASHTPWARTSASSRSLIPLGARVTKAFVIAFAVVAALSLLGYPVTSLIAGLGLGGLAFALAAQKTVENMFGAFSIGVDQPFREGDFVKVDDFAGTVESIGLRSTRFRTLDRTLVTLPNGRLADMRVESFAVRDRLRFATTIGLVYDTSTSQMREVLAGFEAVLRAQPKLWPDVVVVRFSELAAAALNIEVAAWFKTTDWGEFQLIRQEILLQFMGVVARAGTSFAFPTSTVHVASLPVGREQNGADSAGAARGGTERTTARDAGA